MSRLSPLWFAALLFPAFLAAYPDPGRVADSLVKAGYAEEFLPAADSGFAPTPKERKQGFVLFARDRNVEILPNSVPRRAEVGETLRVAATPGEYEPFCFSLHALKDLDGAGFTLTPLASARPTLYDVEYVPLRYRKTWEDEERKNYFVRYPLYLAAPKARRIPAQTSRQYWIDLKIPGDQKPGAYTAAISVSTGNSGTARLTVVLTVLPFTLADAAPRFGAFLAGARSLTLANARDMKAHGLDAVQWFWKHDGLDLENRGGKMAVNFARLDTVFGNLKAAGLRGPVVLALGNDNSAMYERKICQVFNLPLEFPPVERNGEVVKLVNFKDPRLQSLYLDGLTQLRDHARDKAWPEVPLIIFDEAAERLEAEQAERYAFLKKHLPEFPIYGVFMMKGEAQEKQADFCDIVVANSRLDRFRELAREKGKRFWMYTFLGAKCSFGKTRVSYGLYPVHYGAEAMFFWCYDYFTGDPYNEMDGDVSDGEWVIAYPSVADSAGGALRPTPAYLALREAVDDARYLNTLGAAAPDTVRALAKAIVGGTSLRGAALGDAAFFTSARPEAIDGYRSLLIREILRVKNAGSRR